MRLAAGGKIERGPVVRTHRQFIIRGGRERRHRDETKRWRGCALQEQQGVVGRTLDTQKAAFFLKSRNSEGKIETRFFVARDRSEVLGLNGGHRLAMQHARRLPS